ncbi:MAG: zf-HC2 domain-containing protein [Gemmatimonadales bacterium]|nr:zf-HC2 domain-containing protein [Gemmatimonadales bacterium]
MSHLDEGTLHALLDGELELHEVREIQAHLGSCTACDTRLQAAKDVFGEADRLVASVQFPGSVKAPRAEVERVEETLPTAATAAPRRERRIEPQVVGSVDEPQVMILPDENTWPERRRRLLAAGRWAALLLVAVGAGYIASEVRKGAQPAAANLEQAPTAFVSPEETSRPDTTTAAPARAYAGSGSDSAQNRTPLVPRDEAAVRRRSAAPPPPEPRPQQTQNQSADVAEPPAPAAQNEERQVAPAEVDAATQEDIRAEAAEALAELDRQRRRDRAAAATAAIDQARREELEAEPAPAPAPPPPRTLEQRAGVYLRIGLDEAARQLGRPVHVIEGLNSEFMGLVQGRQSPGADSGRPVVRVVYRDSQGRMILLDQQRIRPGQNWPSGGTQWTVGEMGLRLHGDAPGAVLQNLRPRVR